MLVENADDADVDVVEGGSGVWKRGDENVVRTRPFETDDAARRRVAGLKSWRTIEPTILTVWFGELLQWQNEIGGSIAFAGVLAC